mgnify:FL=1
MNKRFGKVLIGAILATIPSGIFAKQWTLKECINYALENNISLQKTQIKKASANEDYLQSKAALLPSLSASSNQNVSYTPWVTSGISGEGFTKSSVDKVYYNGSYSVMGNYVIWNGNKNRNQVKLNKLTYEAAALDSATQAQNLQEQIATLYIQICYSTEAIKVNQESYKSSLENENRGKEFVKIGKMSQADLAQLTAQRAQDEYNIVAAESNVKNYKRQLKELLQITNDEAFDIVIPSTTDSQALASIPALNSVYASALDNRPEIKSYQNMIDQSNLNIDIAKAGKMPTISANAGVSTSSTSMNKTGWETQIKQNFSLGGGVSISIPIYDNRATKTAINKANLQKQSSMLDLKNEQTKLYSTIENYWLQANTNQSQFKSAKVSTESAKTSFELLNEQFKLGLKNIVELRTGKDNLLKAQQNELQAKYLTILNLGLLNFYKNGKVE